jgi:hypothetical protein
MLITAKAAKKPRESTVLRKVLAKKRKTFPKLAFAGRMLSHYERAVIRAKDCNKPFNFIRLHI